MIKPVRNSVTCHLIAAGVVSDVFHERSVKICLSKDKTSLKPASAVMAALSHVVKVLIHF